MHISQEKKDIIDYVYRKCKPRPTSFADLGGIWGVDGEYTFNTLREYGARRAFIVDTGFTDAALMHGKSVANLTLVRGNFGENKIADQIGTVDLVLLFDVLLHQVKPDWNEILQMYSTRTTYFAVFNPQWVASDQTVRLLDLGHDQYFKNVPHTENHPAYRDLFDKKEEINTQRMRAWRDIHDVWQWGITDNDLKNIMGDLHFSLKYYKNYGRVGSLKNFENHAFIFQGGF